MAKKSDSLKFDFELLVNGLGLGTCVKELKFHPTRKWQFDYSWPQYKVAVECEGGAWTGGRHTSGAGFVKDMEKYNEAVLLGWKLFRFTPQQLCNQGVLTLVRYRESLSA